MCRYVWSSPQSNCMLHSVYSLKIVAYWIACRESPGGQCARMRRARGGAASGGTIVPALTGARRLRHRRCVPAFLGPDLQLLPWPNDEPPIRTATVITTRFAAVTCQTPHRCGASPHDKSVYVEAEWNSARPDGRNRYIEGLRAEYGLPTVMVAQAWLDARDAAAVLEAQAVAPFVRSVRHKPRANATNDAAPGGTLDALARYTDLPATACGSTCRRRWYPRGGPFGRGPPLTSRSSEPCRSSADRSAGHAAEARDDLTPRAPTSP